jgi:hypothetical protein
MKRLLIRIFLAVSGACGVHAADAPIHTLAFRIDEGRNINSFVRAGPVAAHLLLRSGNEPRILVAFPAGNSGVGLWFRKTATPVTWTLVDPPKPYQTVDDQHRPLYGIEFTAEVDVAQLQTRDAVLSSIRVLRDYELQGKAPTEVMTDAIAAGTRVTWKRDRLDGAPGFLLTIDGSAATMTAEKFASAGAARLRLTVRALCGETPLHPVDSLLTQGAGSDERARNALAFLSYEEKFLAGSWRFDTYFGRDTMMSAMLLAPVLQPPGIESAIVSVLDRLAPNGEAAHEEDIGEFAVLRNAREGRGRTDAPVYDYGMVDDDFMLAPLVARWLLDDERGRAGAREFLAARGARGETHGAALVRNLAWVVERAAPFARSPVAANLVGIKTGRMTGQWRDSEQGLGRGRFAYDVNATLVPAALDAAARLGEAGLLEGYTDARQKGLLSRAREQSRRWTARAPSMFAVEVSAKDAQARIAAYAREVGVDSAPALTSIGGSAMTFHALSLDADGRAIPILNSDEGFRLLLTQPAPQELARSIRAIMRPFPAGLMTDAGMLVANPALAGPELRNEFSRFAYHGTVVWSWQQALMVAGIDRQLRRRDLPSALRAELLSARKAMWTVIDRSAAMRTSELWSWSFAAGHYQVEPFGRPGADVDESNAAQLWSTVFLGLPHATSDTSPVN